MKKLLLAMAAVAMSMGSAIAADHKANIVVVTHGSDTDAFWGVVRNAVNAAAEDTGADVQYRNPSTGDLNEMVCMGISGPVAPPGAINAGCAGRCMAPPVQLSLNRNG